MAAALSNSPAISDDATITHRSSWGPRRLSPAAALQRIRSHPRQPGMIKNDRSEEPTWWARQMRSRSWRCRKRCTISGPNVNETPRSFSPHVSVSLSGSLHRRSQMSPRLSARKIMTKMCGYIESEIDLCNAKEVGTRIRDISRSLNAPDLIHGLQICK